MAHTQRALSTTQLIAPCGINCRLCRAYQRDRDTCLGCRGDDAGKPKSCVVCRIKTCEKLVAGGHRYCSSCEDYPCDRIRHLDKRYRLKYATSVVENLLTIRQAGVRKFAAAQAVTWACPSCGSLLCMHQPLCPACGQPWRG